MCGIVCAFNIKDNKELIRSNVLKMAQKVRHRGPDWSGIYDDSNAILSHERLAIVDPTSGKQPLICLLYTSPSPRDRTRSRMPSSA